MFIVNLASINFRKKDNVLNVPKFPKNWSQLIWLAVLTILKIWKSLERMIPYIMENKIHVATTNQYIIIIDYHH